MKAIRSFIKASILIVILGAALTMVFSNYGWVFSKKIKGEVIDVQRVMAPTALIGSQLTEAQMYSYSILIQAEDGVLYTSSSEDRKWQVVRKGYCVDVLLYRYPFWNLDKAGTFYNARVEQIRVCPGQKSLPDDGAPGAEPTAPSGAVAPPPAAIDQAPAEHK